MASYAIVEHLSFCKESSALQKSCSVLYLTRLAFNYVKAIANEHLPYAVATNMLTSPLIRDCFKMSTAMTCLLYKPFIVTMSPLKSLFVSDICKAFSTFLTENAKNFCLSFDHHSCASTFLQHICLVFFTKPAQRTSVSYKK